ncbi:MAG: hypothetical protein IPQ04_05890 [Saprospiraceae bacterium]|nr:hypothetical protein [Saprospiraceae bacterium]
MFTIWISLINMVRIVLEASRYNIGGSVDVQGLPNGLYYVELQLEKEVLVL